MKTSLFKISLGIVAYLWEIMLNNSLEKKKKFPNYLNSPYLIQLHHDGGKPTVGYAWSRYEENEIV